MVFFNWATMQMAAKIVYYGPGLCGKTSNLSYIYAKTTPNSRGEMVSLETESDRTLFFDLLPIEVGTIGGFKTRLQLYTVPGQVFYNTTRKLVLKGVDGLVFVADSQRPMREANIESFGSLVDNLKELGLEMSDLPLVLQYNKRDLKNILTIDELNADLNPHSIYAWHESSAINGDGVFETLKEITKLTLKKLRKRMASSQPGAVAPASEPVRPAMPPQRRESISAAALARAAEEGVVDSPVAAPAPPMPATPTTVAPAAAPATEPPPQPEPVAPSPTPETRQPDPPDAGHGEPEDVETDSHVPGAHESDVFDTPQGDVDDIPSGGPLDGPTESVELGSMEVTAPNVVPPDGNDEFAGADEEPDDEVEVEIDEPAEHVDFAQNPSEEPMIEPPPVKRVHVSNQLDILAELEGLRVGSTSGDSAGRSRSSARDLDIDSLISGAVGGSKEVRRRVKRTVGNGSFARMRGLELTVCLKDGDGEVIETLESVLLEVDGAAELKKLTARLAVDLENDG